MVIETTKMSTRGQIIIPRDIREHISSDAGTIFTIATIDKETIILKKMDKKKLVKEFRNIRKRINKIAEHEILAEVRKSRKT